MNITNKRIFNYQNNHVICTFVAISTHILFMRISSYLLASLFILSILLFACGGGADPVAALQDQVIAVHDEVMPKIGEVSELKKQLEAERTRLLAAETPDSLQAEIITGQIVLLEAANEGMMDWMRNFTPPVGKEEAAALTYLQGELDKINGVKEDILQNLESGKAFLKP